MAAALERLPDWEVRIGELLAEAGARPFAWGKWDCAHFAGAVVMALTGADVVPPARYSSAAGAARWLARRGHADVLALADSVLGPRCAPLMARRGDIVSDGQRLGMMWTAGAPVALFVGGAAEDAGRAEVGLVTVPASALVAAWRVG